MSISTIPYTEWESWVTYSAFTMGTSISNYHPATLTAFETQVWKFPFSFSCHARVSDMFTLRIKPKIKTHFLTFINSHWDGSSYLQEYSESLPFNPSKYRPSEKKKKQIGNKHTASQERMLRVSIVHVAKKTNLDTKCYPYRQQHFDSFFNSFINHRPKCM
jgi:hypothetical protein